MVVVGGLGTSAAVPPLGAGDAAGPQPSPYLVTLLLGAAVLVGAAGVLAGLRALADGWVPAPTRLLAGGALAVLALLTVPPMATADVGSYAAYGRMVVLGLDPYTTTPRDLAGDPVADAAEDPWRDAPSVYGPLATAEHWLVAEVAGADRAVALRGLGVVAGAGFLATGLLLDRLCRGDVARRRRTALLWALNPLLLLQLVAAAHLDGLLALAVLAAVGVAGARPARALGSGLLLGVAGSVKASAALPALGLTLWYRRRLPLVVAGGLAVAVPAVVAAGGLHVLEPGRDAGRLVSRGTAWRWVSSGLERLLPFDVARLLVVTAAAVLAVLLARRLLRTLPTGPGQAGAAARAALVPTLAWLLLAPYALPWYDALGWVLLALLAASAFDRLLLVHTTVLTLAYLPGREVPLPGPLDAVLDGLRSVVAPVVVLAVVVLVVRVRAPARSPQTGRRDSVGGSP